MTAPAHDPFPPGLPAGAAAVIAGTGRVGLSLAGAWGRSTGQPPLLLSRHVAEARPRLWAAGLRCPVRSLARWRPAPGLGLLFLAVPDDALEDTARSLAGRLATIRAPGWLALHTSGYHSAAVLAPLRESALAVGSWHPLQTFPRPDPALLAGIAVVLEGDPPAVEAGAALARHLGARPVILPASFKPLYHCLATIAASHAAALLNFCRSALAEIPPEAREPLWLGLQDLAGAAIRNLGGAGDPPVFTGPAARGARRTIQGHQELLSAHFPSWAGIYRSLSDALEQEKKRTGRDPVLK